MKFSIILPAKNGIHFITQCVQSILNQSYKHFDLLVLLHDNEDGVEQWLQSLNDERIHIYAMNGIAGITQNWARIKSIPKNEFMTIIGYDDVFLPDYLEKMNALIKCYPDASLYQSHFDYIDAKGNIVRACQKMESVIPVQAFLNGEFLQTMDSMGTGYMMRSCDYDALGGIPEHYPNLIFADYELWVRLTAKSFLAVEQTVCFQYRLHNSVSKVTNGEDYANAYFKYLDFLQLFRKDNTGVDAAIREYGYAFMIYFCESLSHRLLKTKYALRKQSVREFVDKNKAYAEKLLPGYAFNPMKVKRIALAVWFDKNQFTRLAFKVVKQMTLLFNR